MGTSANGYVREHASWQVVLTGLLLAWVFLGLSSFAYAFGQTGHRVVAKIAEKHLSPQARKAVKNLLGSDSLIEASTWPDEIRSDDNWKHAESWHYVNIPDLQQYQRRSRQADEAPRDIVEAIEHFESILNDEAQSPTERAVALRWLVHLVGDIHQPLHVGRAKDQGGNLIDAVWHGQMTNLHQIWDSELIDSTKLSYSELAKSISTASRDQIDMWQASKVVDWANESLPYRQQVYMVPPANPVGSYRYSYKNLRLLKRRLEQAGVRLAGRLNEVFQNEGPPAWDQIMPNGLHWFRNSTEYKALVYQVYGNATRELERLYESG